MNHEEKIDYIYNKLKEQSDALHRVLKTIKSNASCLIDLGENGSLYAKLNLIDFKKDTELCMICAELERLYKIEGECISFRERAREEANIVNWKGKSN